MEAVVGVRKLKNDLSHYLREVKEGKSVTVTERGRVVALLVPPDTKPDILAAKELAQAGLGSWRGGKPKGSARPAPIKGETLSAIVIAERG